jgi:hypothetical protein
VADDNGVCLEPDEASYALTSPTAMFVELLVQPAAFEAGAGAQEWDLCISEWSLTRLHRATFGLLGADAVDAGGFYLGGCQQGPNLEGEWDCTEQVGADSEMVNELVTFTRGPLDADDGLALADTLYAPLEGGYENTGGVEVLNPFSGWETCIGEVTNDAIQATAGAPPIPIRNGFSTLNYHDVGQLGPQPYQTADSQLEVPPDAVHERILFNDGDDIDSDGITDSSDNCPFFNSSDLSDRGGLGDTQPNGIGDACECGDANGSGAVVDGSVTEYDDEGSPLPSDLQMIREYLVGMRPGEPHIPAICSVTGGADCDTADAVVLQRFLAQENAVPHLRCENAVD